MMWKSLLDEYTLHIPYLPYFVHMQCLHAMTWSGHDGFCYKGNKNG